MDLQAVLSEVRNWTVDDRLHLIEELWDGLSGLEKEHNLSDDVRALLDGRVADADAVSSLDEVWTRVVERYRR